MDARRITCPLVQVGARHHLSASLDAALGRKGAGEPVQALAPRDVVLDGGITEACSLPGGKLMAFTPTNPDGACELPHPRAAEPIDNLERLAAAKLKQIG